MCQLMRIVGLFLLASMLSGCGVIGNPSPSVHFYRLAPATDITSLANPQVSVLPISIEAVQIPDWLRRPQLVTEGAGAELLVDDYSRWGGKLDHMLGDTIASNIATAFNSQVITAYPIIVKNKNGYRVFISVTDFIRHSDGSVRLDAGWIITQPDGKTILYQGVSRVALPAPDGNISALMLVYSQAVTNLSQEIAAKIVTLVAH